MLYGGWYFDAAPRSYYAGHRTYSQQQGRFASRDPIGIWGDLGGAGNGYAYVGDRPVMGWDPEGLEPPVRNPKIDTLAAKFRAALNRGDQTATDKACGALKAEIVRAETQARLAAQAKRAAARARAGASDRVFLGMTYAWPQFLQSAGEVGGTNQAMADYEPSPSPADARLDIRRGRNAGIALGVVYSFDLSHEEEERLVKQANNGSSDAAFRLYYFYEFVKLDRDRALSWLDKSAQLGSVPAQYHLGCLYLDDANLKDLLKARIWLEKAAQGGSQEAKRKLLSL